MEEKGEKIAQSAVQNESSIRTSPPPIASHTLLRTPVAAATRSKKKTSTPRPTIAERPTKSSGALDLSSQMQLASDKLKDFSAEMSHIPAHSPSLIQRTVEIAVEHAPRIVKAKDDDERQRLMEEALLDMQRRLQEQSDNLIYLENERVAHRAKASDGITGSPGDFQHSYTAPLRSRT